MSLMYLSKNVLVSNKDVDNIGNMKPFSILDKFQDLAGEHADIIGVGFNDLIKQNLAWIVMYETIEVVNRLPKNDELIKIITWPKPQYKLEFEREYEIRDELDNLLVKGISNWAVLDINKRRIARADSIIFNGEYINQTNYPNKVPRRLNLACDEFISTTYYEVADIDIDSNGHMNNAKYIDAVYNLFYKKIDTRFKKLQIAFIHEARLGQIIKINYYKNEDNNDAFIGYIEDQLSFELIIEMEK